MHVRRRLRPERDAGRGRQVLTRDRDQRAEVGAPGRLAGGPARRCERGDCRSRADERRQHVDPAVPEPLVPRARAAGVERVGAVRRAAGR